MKGGTNLYGYVANPTGIVDPLGLSGYLGTDLSSFTSGNACKEGRVGNGITGYDEHGVPTFDESHPSFHHYYGSNSCTKGVAGCSYENAKAGLLRYPAPGGTGEEPITNGQISFAMPVGSVRHAVIDGDSQVVNITLPCRHSLHPGIVRRWVTQDANSVTVHTYGEGTGPFARINEALSDSLWRGVDENIFDYMGQQK